MYKKILTLTLVSSFFIAACQQDTQTAGSDASPAVDKSEAVAVVNGTYISKAAFEALKKDIAKRTQGQEFPNEQLLDELIKRELLVQEAEQKKLVDTPEVKASLDAMRKTVLTQAAMQDFLKSNVVTDEELKIEFDKKVGGGKTEYKARHILVKTEEEAKGLIENLTKGGNFEELAKQHSTGPSATNGGDLGWFMPQQMVPPFSEAVVALENGKFTMEPVQTNFGWHIILKEDSRAQAAPPFESVKEQLRPMLQRQKLHDYLVGLRDKAEIEILISDEKPEQQSGDDSEKPAATEEPPAAASDETKDQDKEEAPAESEKAEVQDKTEVPAETETAEESEATK